MSNVKSTTFTAPRCRILLDGKIVGKGTNVQFTVEYEYQDIDVLDNIEVEEFAPVSYRVNGSIGIVGAVGTTVKSLGMFPETGKDKDEHLLNVLLHGQSVLQLMDKVESKTLHYLYGTVFASHGFSVAARGISGVNVNFKSIRHQDESEV